MCALECEARIQPCVAPQALWCLKQSLIGTSVSLIRLGGLTSEPRDLPVFCLPNGITGTPPHPTCFHGFGRLNPEWVFQSCGFFT